MLVRLPVPPSVNALYGNRKTRSPLEVITGARKKAPGRFKTKIYKAWITEAGWELKLQKPEKFDGEVAILLEMPEASGIDLDNGFKASIDLLVRHQVIPNDHKKFVRHIAARWHAWDKMHVHVSKYDPLGSRGAVQT